MNLFGKDKLEVTIINQDEVPVRAFISLERDHSFFPKIINPVGSFYHHICTGNIEGNGKLNNIRSSDRLVLFANRSVLPIQLQLKRKDIYRFELNSSNLPPLLEENGMKRDLDCVLFNFEIQDTSIKLLHAEYFWSAEGNQRCKAMELIK